MFKIIKKFMAKTKKEATKKVVKPKKVEELTNEEIYASLGKKMKHKRRKELGM